MNYRAAQNRFIRLLLLTVVLTTTVVVAGQADVSVRGDLTHEMELQPGSRHTGSIVLQNSGSERAEVKLYQTDYRSEAPGRHFYEDPGTNPRSNASWIAISPLRFTIPPGESYTIPYVIDVPSDPALAGSYWSVLMIEPIPPESPESADANPEQTAVGILTLVRYGFKFVTHIGATGSILPEITNAALSLSNGVPTLGIDIANAGTRVLEIEIWAELYDGDGQFLGRKDGVPGNVYPSSSREYQIGLDDIPVGSYTALVVIDAGENNVFGATLPLLLE